MLKNALKANSATISPTTVLTHVRLIPNTSVIPFLESVCCIALMDYLLTKTITGDVKSTVWELVLHTRKILQEFVSVTV